MYVFPQINIMSLKVRVITFFYSIDATTTTGHLCHYVNDIEHAKANSTMKKIMVQNVPRLALFACKDIHIGDELLYDYGDSSHNLWWRTKVFEPIC